MKRRRARRYLVPNVANMLEIDQVRPIHPNVENWQRFRAWLLSQPSGSAVWDSEVRQMERQPGTGELLRELGER
ncbi:MAG: hypothetical protein IT159_12785 [Bryobacterales bacterium]|jgi:hypothetical protein|nr:hypothetical protein [Bryobacterales bacterium]